MALVKGLNPNGRGVSYFTQPTIKVLITKKTTRVMTIKFHDFCLIFVPEKMENSFFGSADPKCPKMKK